jgi:hypothetical protein
VLDRAPRKRVFLTTRETALPEPGDEFTLFNGQTGNLNDRSVIRDNSTVVLRTHKLQTVLLEKPVRGVLEYRKRLELKVLGGDELGLDPANSTFPVESRWWLRVLCATNNGQLCSGRGACKAGKCQCGIEYDGPACQFKRKFAFCHVTGDPHVQTFDRKRYNVFSEGEFLAYSNVDSGNNEAVTVSMAKVKSTITSVVRRVAVRQGSTIVTVGASNEVQVNCGRGMARLIKSKKDEGLIVKGTNLSVRWQKEARRWRISSGDSGLVVWVKSYSWGISVWVRAFTAPRGIARGLCGNFDGDMDNDIGPTEWPLQEHYQPNAHFLEDVGLPEGKGLVLCEAPGLSFAKVEDDIEQQMWRGQDIVVGELPAALTDAEKQEQLEQATKLLADADAVCGNSAKRRAARKRCECRGFNKVETFNLFADCVLDECETSNNLFVKSACDAEQTDADEASRIVSYQQAIDQLEKEQEYADHVKNSRSG